MAGWREIWSYATRTRVGQGRWSRGQGALISNWYRVKPNSALQVWEATIYLRIRTHISVLEKMYRSKRIDLALFGTMVMQKAMQLGPTSWNDWMRGGKTAVHSNVLAVNITRIIYQPWCYEKFDLGKQGHLPEARKRAAFAISRCVPGSEMRLQWLKKYAPSGTPKRACALSWPSFPAVPRWWAYSKVNSVMPVRMRPGQIEFTRISLFCNW